MKYTQMVVTNMKGQSMHPSLSTVYISIHPQRISHIGILYWFSVVILKILQYLKIYHQTTQLNFIYFNTYKSNQIVSYVTLDMVIHVASATN